MERINGYRRPVEDFINRAYARDERHIELQEEAARHPIYDYIPRHRNQLHDKDPRRLLSVLFGNDEDGLFGECANPPYSEKISWMTALRWGVRNNFHNFKYRVMGTAERKEHKRFALIDLDSRGKPGFFTEPDHPKVFGKGRFTFYLGHTDYLPFVSFRLGWVEGYLGWREQGNFGGPTLRRAHLKD